MKWWWENRRIIFMIIKERMSLKVWGREDTSTSLKAHDCHFTIPVTMVTWDNWDNFVIMGKPCKATVFKTLLLCATMSFTFFLKNVIMLLVLHLKNGDLHFWQTILKMFNHHRTSRVNIIFALKNITHNVVWENTCYVSSFVHGDCILYNRSEWVSSLYNTDCVITTSKYNISFPTLWKE